MSLHERPYSKNTKAKDKISGKNYIYFVFVNQFTNNLIDYVFVDVEKISSH